MHKTTKDIGKLSGKVLVFGGVYSNLQALETLQEIAKTEGIESHNVICTGDIVAYCAQPEEVVQTMKEWDVHTIAGNVEIQLRNNEEDCGCDFRDGSRCDSFSKLWYPFAKTQLSENSLSYISRIPDFIKGTYAGKKFIVVHGSYHETAEYIFKSTQWSIKAQNFKDTDSEIILSGHCGLPFSEANEGKLWLNAGVIGMPANDGTSRVWYMIVDTDAAGNVTYEHRSFTYDNAKTTLLMNQADLTPEYAKTLSTGLWDNCEILPDEETALQGVAIGF